MGAPAFRTLPHSSHYNPWNIPRAAFFGYSLQFFLHRLHDVRDIAVHDRRHIMPRLFDTVIGDAVLGEVLRANLFGALLTADLRAPGGFLRFFGLADFCFQKLCPQYFVCAFAVCGL